MSNLFYQVPDKYEAPSISSLGQSGGADSSSGIYERIGNIEHMLKNDSQWMQGLISKLSITLGSQIASIVTQSLQESTTRVISNEVYPV
jgi:hypothetical protein